MTHRNFTAEPSSGNIPKYQIFGFLCFHSWKFAIPLIGLVYIGKDNDTEGVFQFQHVCFSFVQYTNMV